MLQILTKRPRTTKLLIVAVITAAIGLVALYFFGSRANAAEYTTSRVERGTVRNTVSATGTLKAVTTVQVGSQASGTVSAMYADFNSTVKKGQVVAQLDPAVFQAQVQQAQANVEQARAGLDQARAAVEQSRAGVSDAQARVLAAKSTTQNQQAGVTSAQANLEVLKAQRDDAQSFLRQQQSLVASGVIAQRDLEMAETSFKTAEAKYNQAVAQLSQAVLSEQSASTAGLAQSQAQSRQATAQVSQSVSNVKHAEAQVQQAVAALDLAQINLSNTTIRSPIDGIVVSRDVDVGQTVAASLSAPTLFTIANDLSQMQVIANIDQADIGQVGNAKEATFTVDAFPDREFKGTIKEVRLNPQTVQNVVTYNVVLDVNNADQILKPGMTANLAITIGERPDVMKVPNAALRFAPQTTGTRRRDGNSNRSAQRQGADSQAGGGVANAATSGDAGAQADGQRRGNITRSTAPVLEGQTRLVWVLGQGDKLEPRRVKVGLSDGSATEIVEGELKIGDRVVTGQTVTASTRTQNSSSGAPGFGGAPGGGMPRGGGGGRGR